MPKVHVKLPNGREYDIDDPNGSISDEQAYQYALSKDPDAQAKVAQDKAQSKADHPWADILSNAPSNLLDIGKKIVHGGAGLVKTAALPVRAIADPVGVGQEMVQGIKDGAAPIMSAGAEAIQHPSEIGPAFLQGAADQDTMNSTAANLGITALTAKPEAIPAAVRLGTRGLAATAAVPEALAASIPAQKAVVGGAIGAGAGALGLPGAGLAREAAAATLGAVGSETKLGNILPGVTPSPATATAITLAEKNLDWAVKAAAGNLADPIVQKAEQALTAARRAAGPTTGMGRISTGVASALRAPDRFMQGLMGGPAPVPPAAPGVPPPGAPPMPAPPGMPGPAPVGAPPAAAPAPNWMQQTQAAGRTVPTMSPTDPRAGILSTGQDAYSALQQLAGRSEGAPHSWGSTEDFARAPQPGPQHPLIASNPPLQVADATAAVNRANAGVQTDAAAATGTAGRTPGPGSSHGPTDEYFNGQRYDIGVSGDAQSAAKASKAKGMRDWAANKAAERAGILDKLKGPAAEEIPGLNALEGSLAPGSSMSVVEPGNGPALNASGDSAASAEAMSRQAGMTGRGEQFVVYDRAGNVRPLIGPEAVDYQAKPGEIYGVKTKDGFRPLDNQGGKVPSLGEALGQGAPLDRSLEPALQTPAERASADAANRQFRQDWHAPEQTPAAPGPSKSVADKSAALAAGKPDMTMNQRLAYLANKYGVTDAARQVKGAGESIADAEARVTAALNTRGELPVAAKAQIAQNLSQLKTPEQIAAYRAQSANRPLALEYIDKLLQRQSILNGLK